MTATARRRVPDFFIAGAPRCGTTALYEYLRAHPQLFLPHTKEPCHLCPDLDSGSADDALRFMRDAERYLSLFEGVGGDRIAGEACVLYLYSREAPRLITMVNPTARILVMLRNPVEQIYSHHAARVAGGEEHLGFAAALDAELDRAAGRRLPPHARNIRMYQYREIARYAGPLARYLEHFGPDRVRVMFLEEFRSDPGRHYGETLDFLGVGRGLGSGSQPRFEVVNANRRASGGLAYRMVRWPPLIMGAKNAVPGRFRPAAARLATRLLRVDTREEPRAPMDAGLRERLVAEFRPDVARLSALLCRDLLTLWPEYAEAI